MSYNNQQGALFGLDARIALAVFSLLAVITGAAMVLNMSEARAKGLVAELVDTAKAIEGFHADVRGDIFQVLTEPSEARAFQALYDNTVVSEQENWRARWSGPYLRASSNHSASFGEMSLQKRGPDHTKSCDADTLCFLWLVYSSVKPAVVREANDLLDGTGEANAATAGRLQWSQTEDNQQILYFRSAKALLATGQF